MSFKAKALSELTKNLSEMLDQKSLEAFNELDATPDELKSVFIAYMTGFITIVNCMQTIADIKEDVCRPNEYRPLFYADNTRYRPYRVQEDDSEDNEDA